MSGRFHNQRNHSARGAGRCHLCQQKIEFVRHRDTLKPAPLDPGYSDNGNLWVEGDTYIVLAGEVLQKAKTRGFPMRINHYATCKVRQQHGPQNKQAA